MPQTPNTLGKYQIIREIARSNDIVYEAYDPVMHRRVAVKELDMPGGATSQQKEDRIKRFMREARAAGSLVHPNIVTVYEVAEQGDRHYIAMEFLDGQTLRQEMEATGFLDPSRAVLVAKEILAGLDFAHKNGVVHRDIKPENIQILENGQIKLTDFGIARLMFEPNLTMDGQVFGTPSYMSPEQINGKEIDARSDVFSVGVILYEMVAGAKPFTGDSVMSITYAIMNKEPDQPGQCPYGLWQIVHRALDKSPVMRYDSAQAMIDALTSAEKGLAPGAVIDPPSAFAPSQPMPYAQPAQPTGGPVNPYAPPVQGQPLSQPMPYSTAPYGQPQQPYGQPTPYNQTPYGAAPYPQPQPYGAQQPYGTQQPYNPYATGASPIGPVPVYYPPPPRRPMISAEAKATMGNLVKWTLIVGLILLIVLTGINALSSAFADAQRPARAAPGSSSPAASTSPAPPSGGAVSTGGGAPAQAPPIQQPNRPKVDVPAILNQAQEAVDRAVIEDFDTRRGELWEQAAKLFAKAATESPADAEAVNRAAVESFLNAANLLAQNGRPARAREALCQAQAFTKGMDDEYAKIRQALKYLGN